MPTPGETVFLSYRRGVSWATAHLVREHLTFHGHDVFMDTGSLDSGEFEREILSEITYRTHFVVLLEPGSLDRIAEPGDWLRSEVAHALATGRNVVPLLAGGLPPPRAEDLPPDIARLASFNAVSIPPDYVTEALAKLRTRFLRIPDLGPELTVSWYSTNTDLVAGRHSRSGYLRVRWSAVPGARHYELEEARDGLPWRTVYQGSLRGYRADVHSRPRYRVRGGGSAWSEVVTAPEAAIGAGFAVVQPILEVPALALRSSGLALSWSAAFEATEYVVERALEIRRFDHYGGAHEIHRGPEREIIHRPPRGRLGWRTDVYRVRAGFAEGEVGPWSALRTGRVVG